MNIYSRRAIIGVFAGAIGSSILAITLHNSIVGVFLGILVGGVYASPFARHRRDIVIAS